MLCSGTTPEYWDQNATNCTIAPWYKLDRALAQARRTLTRLGGAEDGKWWAFHGLTAGLQQLYHATNHKLPWCLRSDTLEAMRDRYQDQYVFLPLDKNGGKMVCMCRRLYYKHLLALYEDKKQFKDCTYM